VGVEKPEPLEDTGLHGGNLFAAADLLRAIEEDRPPLADVHSARAATEMIVAVFESHRLGRPVSLPLENRGNPLTMFGQSLYERLRPVIGAAKCLPPDASVNVDHYLYGHPRNG